MNPAQLGLYGTMATAVLALAGVVYQGFGERGKQRRDESAQLRKELQDDLIERAQYFEERVGKCDKRCGELSEQIETLRASSRLEVEALREGMHTMLERVEDEIIPMLLPEDTAIKSRLRQIVADGRANLRRKLMGDEYA